MKTFLIFAIVFLSSCSLTGLQEEQFDKDFLVFKEKLEKCIERKDTSALKELLYDRILESADHYTCGPDGCSKEEFIYYYFVQSDHWDVLNKIVRLGFYGYADTFQYSFIKHPWEPLVYEGPAYLKEVNEGYQNGYSKLAILAENLNVRERPSVNSRVLTQISYGTYVYEQSDYGSAEVYESEDGRYWVKISLEDGRSGFVAYEYTSETIIKNLKVAKIQGQWKIFEFYNGPGC